MKVKDLMTKPAVCISCNASVQGGAENERI